MKRFIENYLLLICFFTVLINSIVIKMTLFWIAGNEVFVRSEEVANELASGLLIGIVICLPVCFVAFVITLFRKEERQYEERRKLYYEQQRKVIEHQRRYRSETPKKGSVLPFVKIPQYDE